MSQLILTGKCSDCGKKVHFGYSAKNANTGEYEWVPSNCRTFNDRKITRCMECCDKQSIKPAVYIKKGF